MSMRRTSQEMDLKYIGKAYINKVELALLGLDRLSHGEELLSFDPFNLPLYELLYAAIVTGIEDYLRDTLKRIVLESEERIHLYAQAYHKRNRNRRDKNGKGQKIIVSEGQPITNEIVDIILDTLDNRHIYHNIEMINGYFKAVIDIGLPEDELLIRINDIIKTRHIIIHQGGNLPNGEHVKMSSYMVHQALETAKTFIRQTEDYLEEKGFGRLYDVPDEPTE